MRYLYPGMLGIHAVKRLMAKLQIMLCTAAMASTLINCGGSSNNNPVVTPRQTPNSGWTENVFSPADDFANQCVSPRSGVNPRTEAPYTDTQGSRTDENNWLRSWSNDLYLWYDEIIDTDPALLPTDEYFAQLKTDALTPSGNNKDNFHFAQNTEDWLQLSQSGVSSGYGVKWAIAMRTVPREIYVAYTEPNSPATSNDANLTRGAKVISIDGFDIINSSDASTINSLNRGLSPGEAGESHTFEVQDVGSEGTRTFTMTSADVTSTPIQNVTTFDTESGRVGYMLFNDHIATAELGLVEAISQLQGEDIDDLILDLRYNGGGFLIIAAQLGYMIAGNNSPNQTFYSNRFNDKHQTFNPVTNQLLRPLNFTTTSVGLSIFEPQDLPTLNLNRVFVITGLNTCSASEAVMNGLVGIGVEVIQIGATTCGKPYGFYPADNCGTTYFTVQFRGENAMGFGEYSDGFSPSNTLNNRGTVLPGCAVNDDYTHNLGDRQEARIAAALAYRENGAEGCPSPPNILAKRSMNKNWHESTRTEIVVKPQALQNIIMRATP